MARQSVRLGLKELYVMGMIRKGHPIKLITKDPDYDEYLETTIHEIEKTLAQLILAHWEHKPIDLFIEEIEEWMGDDWHVDLSDEDMKRWEAVTGYVVD